MTALAAIGRSIFWYARSQIDTNADGDATPQMGDSSSAAACQRCLLLCFQPAVRHKGLYQHMGRWVQYLALAHEPRLRVATGIDTGSWKLLTVQVFDNACISCVMLLFDGHTKAHNKFSAARHAILAMLPCRRDALI